MTKEQSEGEATTDPFAFWRQWYEQNQSAWGKGVAEATGTEAFAEMQGKMLETFIAFQRSLRDASRAQLEALDLPSRGDVARLGEIVLGLEEKIDQIGDRLDRIEGSSSPGAGDAGRASRKTARSPRAARPARRAPKKR